MQIIIDLKNENIAKNVLRFLESLENKGVHIISKGRVESSIKNTQATFRYKKLNPMEHYYTLSNNYDEKDMTNPFKE